MPPPTPVHIAFDRFGRAVGMELHKRAWYQRTEEVITVCGLQKSQYGPSYYVNVGFNFAGLDSDPHPHPERCHLRVRIEQFIRDEGQVAEVRGLLDLEREIDESVREDRLFEIFDEYLAPVVRRSSSVAGIRAMVADGTLPDYMLTLKARQVLEIPLPQGEGQG
jgi:hypothetical protein